MNTQTRRVCADPLPKQSAVLTTDPMVSRGSPALYRVVLAASLCVLVILVLWDFDFMHDDAYISFRYAQNLALGHGLVFNPGERVEGYSNLLWVLLMALVIRSGLPVVLIAKLLGAALTAGTLLAVFRISRFISIKPTFIDCLATLLLSLSWFFASWATGGLETSLFAFTLTISTLCYLVEQRRGRVRYSSVPFGLLPLIRPEGAIYFFAIFVHRFLSVLVSKRDGRVFRDLLYWMSIFLIIPAMYTIWRFFYYGELLPNTFSAKVGNGGVSLWLKGTHYLFSYMGTKQVMGVLVLLGFAIGAVRLFPTVRQRVLVAGEKERLSIILALIFVVGVHVVFVVMVGGDWMRGYRFIVPVVPFIFLLVQEAAREIKIAVGTLLTPPNRGSHRFALGTSLAVLAAMVAAGDSFISEARIVGVRADLSSSWFARLTVEQYRAHFYVAKWLSEELPQDGLIATGEAGKIPFYSGLRTIDYVGLNDKYIATLPGLLHDKTDASYVLSRRPDAVIVPVRGVYQKNDVWKGRSNADDAVLKAALASADYRVAKVIPLDNQDTFVIFTRSKGNREVVSKDFLQDLSHAEMELPNAPIDNPWGSRVTVTHFTINEKPQFVLYEAAPAKVTYQVSVPDDAFLKFDLGIHPEMWRIPSDGVTFRIGVRTADEDDPETIFVQHLDPYNKRSDRQWFPVAVDLARFAGQNIYLDLVSDPGPAKNDAADWAGWAELRMVRELAIEDSDGTDRR